jgi:cytochrome P450
MHRITRDYGGVIALRLVHRRIWLVTDPPVIEAVLVTRAKEFQKHFALKLNQGVLNNGLLTSERDFWLRQRRLSQPAFLKPQVAKYVPTFIEHTTHLLDRWQPSQTRDILQEMMSLTMGITSRALFGVDADIHAPKVRSALDVSQQEFVNRLQRLVQIPQWIPIPGNVRLRQAIRDLDAIVYDFIRQRRASTEPRDDLLSRLLHARDMDHSGMTDEQLRDECVTIFLAGQETTALALSWTWYLLAEHPEAASRIYAEVDEVLNGRVPTFEDLPRLPETEHALLESMRLYPPAFIIGREAIDDMELAGYFCPRGTTILMPQAVVHRDPRYFANPDTFDPTRWRNDLEKRLPHCTYFPFGGGPRTCIGNTFAMVEMTLVLALIAQRFQFDLVPGQTIKASQQFTLRPSPGIMAKIIPR